MQSRKEENGKDNNKKNSDKSSNNNDNHKRNENETNKTKRIERLIIQTGAFYSTCTNSTTSPPINSSVP